MGRLEPPRRAFASFWNKTMPVDQKNVFILPDQGKLHISSFFFFLFTLLLTPGARLPVLGPFLLTAAAVLKERRSR